MALSGKQKAAMLVMSLDAGSAAELLRGLAAEDIEEIGVEVARLEASGMRDSKQEVRITRDFVQSLQPNRVQSLNLRSFFGETLAALVGKDKAEEIQAKARKATEKKDSFAIIRSASADELVLALEGEHPQTVAVVLSELTPAKSQQVLSMLSEQLRLKAVCKLASQDALGAAVRERMASMVTERLKNVSGERIAEKPEKREKVLRKLAIVLSGLEKELRDQLLEGIKKNDEETCTMIRHLMITWEDIPSIADRSVQEALRTVEPKTLAVALHGAEEEIASKIRSNISERAVAALDEETSLMQEPLPKEILEAREAVVKPLREANEQDKLRFAQR